ncbi:chloromuconate cycloisomerase [Rufibacter sp. DG15C]|uniref:o-succinylbenzoate synthase n=1 Tax=Rufibacter sp. DG15C TaxID=1379909 RepID=UPI00078E3B21|nr:o-succinylbenzoate synthase [Rufibacter sp. DG15C]AMM52095.1 chloromuconate cycloisomerase [Rufibacter sp. DG15C]
MPFVLTPFQRALQFKFDARTSRGAMQTHQAHFIRVHHTDNPAKQGWGECSPLPGLSPDYSADFFELLQTLCQQYNALESDSYEDEKGFAFWKSLEQWPSVNFGFETAFVDYMRGGDFQLYPSAFARSEQGIKINGLVWMGDPAFMREQIKKKLAQGFTCLKLKIGGLDFAQELSILEEIRRVASPEAMELRLDANGAFDPTEALFKLDQLARFSIHSIEQPIRQGQGKEMREVCQHSPIPVALDEELIGVVGKENRWELLKALEPAYIIIKPTLVGGLTASREWIQVAQSMQVDWWMTSALESNIGLNAIAQFAASFQNPLPQGLGTGQLYHNNLASPLEIRGEELWYAKDKAWELPT